MNTEKNYYSNIIDSICIYFLTLGQIYCLDSAFKIGSTPFIINSLAIVFSIIIGITTTICSKKAYFAFSVFSVVFMSAISIANYKNVVPQFYYILNRIFDSYGIYENVMQLDFSGKEITKGTAIFILLSFCLILIYSFLIIRIKRISLVIIFSVLLISPCYFYYITMPKLSTEIVIIISLFALLIKNNINRINYYSSYVSTFFGIIIAIATIIITVAIIPENNFERKEWQNNIYYKIDDYIFGKNKTLDYSANMEVEKKIDISKLSTDLKLEIKLQNETQKRENHIPIMEIGCKKTGILYLKGVAYSNYNDNVWSILNDEQLEKYPDKYPATEMTNIYSVTDEFITIKTEKAEDVVYTPYFLQEVTTGVTSIGDIFILNNTKQKTYSEIFAPYISKTISNTCAFEFFDNTIYEFSYEKNEDSEKYKEFVYKNYLQIPEDTKNSLLEIAEEKNFFELEKEKLPYKVANYVSNSAKYSLHTVKMPKGKDFPVWFLKESNTGYCVHYATATTLMLRAMGIPARYVTGYVTKLGGEGSYVNIAKELIISPVTSDNSHAWVEYFDDEIGWVPIDPTPSAYNLEDLYYEDENENLISTTNEPTNSEETTVEATTIEPTTVQPTTSSIILSTDENNENNTNYGNNRDKFKKSFLKNIIIDDTIKVFFKRFFVAYIILSSICLAFYIRRKIILMRRFNTFKRGNKNERVKNMQRYIIRLSNYSHIMIDDDVKYCFDKARFSNLSVTKEELEKVSNFTKQCIKNYEKSLSEKKKLYYQYILVII